MPVLCRYHCGRIINIDFVDRASCGSIDTSTAYNIILINSGCLSLNIEQKIIKCTAPCVLILKEHLQVDFISSKKLSAQIICFDVGFLNKNITFEMINSRDYENRMDDFAFIPLNVFYENQDSFLYTLPLTVDEQKCLNGLFSEFCDVVTNQTDTRWSCRARMHLTEILELIHQVYTDFFRDDIGLSFDSRNFYVWVMLIVKKIHVGYAQNISLQTMSDYVHINKTTVSKRFKEATGSSVTEYIINYRIKCACHMLSTTYIKICEIAEECGFRSEAYFVKQFHARMGVTPAIYRVNMIQRRMKEFDSQTINKDIIEMD